MTLFLALLNPAMALDCASLDADICDAANDVAREINAVAQEQLVFDGASQARLRPAALYDAFEGLLASAGANGCALSAVAIEDGMGGVWSTSSRTWQGSTTSGSVTEGTFDIQSRTWDGTIDGLPLFGTEFAVFNRQMQVVGNAEDQFVAGTWIRTSGRNGVHATVFGSCDNSIAEAFDDWFIGGLEEFLPPVSEDPSFLGQNVANGSCNSLFGELPIDNVLVGVTETADGVYTATGTFSVVGTTSNATVTAVESSTPGVYDLTWSESAFSSSGTGTATPEGQDYRFNLVGNPGSLLSGCDLVLTPVTPIPPTLPAPN